MSNMKAPLPQCAAMVRVQNILSGKWKITILWYIAEYEVQRFGELRRRLGDINQGLFPKFDAGLYTDGSTDMVVSRGIGNSIIPFRFNNRPEIVLVELCAE
ncbi:transcriptional regulator [Lachnospiraceae bacterium]|nr:transcriptional regulator [Lachnospiraceae bacterium]